MKKKVQFDYYKVYHIVNNQKVELDLSNLFETMNGCNPTRTTRNYKGENARIQTLTFDDDKKIWEIQLLRLRETVPPGIAYEEGGYEPIRLESNEFVGEFASALYDTKTKTFVLHRNRNSLTPSGLEKYFSQLAEISSIEFVPMVDNKDMNEYLGNKIFKKFSIGVYITPSGLEKYFSQLAEISSIEFVPMVDNKDMNEYLGNKIFKKFSIGVYSKDFLEESRVDNKNDYALIDTLKNSNPFGSRYTKLEFSCGRGGKNERLYANEIVKNALFAKGKKSVSSLKATVQSPLDAEVEEIDLLLNRIKDICEFDVSKENPLTHERVYPILLNNYLERRMNFI